MPKGRRSIGFILAMGITTMAVIACSNLQPQKKIAGTFTVHTDDLNGPCHVCHPGSGEVSGSENLLASGKELCFRCHPSKGDKAFVHTAIKDWGCTICHNPHGTGYPYLLRDPMPALCFGCHVENDVNFLKEHRNLTKKMYDVSQSAYVGQQISGEITNFIFH